MFIYLSVSQDGFGDYASYWVSSISYIAWYKVEVQWGFGISVISPFHSVGFPWWLRWLKWNMKVLVAQSCLTLCDPMDCSPPSSSVCEILQARILEWIAIPFSRGSSQPRNWRQVSCTVANFLPTELPRNTSDGKVFACNVGDLGSIKNKKLT